MNIGKFLKQNWFKLSIIILMLAGVVLATYYFVTFLPSQLDLQAKCSFQAEKILKDYQTRLIVNDGAFQRNHYNSKLDKCFVFINDQFINNQETANKQIDTTYEYFLDGFENQTLATLFLSTAEPPRFTIQDGAPREEGLPGWKNATYEEFTEFVNQRMEL